MKKSVYTAVAIAVILVSLLLTSTSGLASHTLDKSVWEALESWNISPAAQSADEARLMIKGRMAQHDGENPYFAITVGNSQAVATRYALTELYTLWGIDQAKGWVYSTDYYYALATEFMSRVKIFQLTEESKSGQQTIMAMIYERVLTNDNETAMIRVLPEETTSKEVVLDAVWRLNLVLDLLDKDRRYDHVPAGTELIPAKRDGAIVYYFHMLGVLYPDYKEEDYK